MSIRIPTFCSALIITYLGATASAADGVLVIDLNNNSRDLAAELAVTPNGRVYVGSYRFRLEGENLTDAHSVILALDSSGASVVSFGINGQLLDMGNRGIATLADDSLTVMQSDLVHINATGTVRRTVDDMLLSGTSTFQPDGKYVVFGEIREGLAVPTRWSMLRFNSDGTPDPTLAGGLVQRSASPYTPWHRQVIVLPDGKILAGGQMHQSSGPELPIAWLIDSNGVPVADFGFNGLAYQPGCQCTVLSDTGYMYGHIAFDPNANKMYMSGTDRAVSRLDMTGALDTSFAALSLDPTTSIVRIEVDSQGRLLVFGSTYDGDDGQGSEGYVSRYLSSGAPDTTFGAAGTAIVHIGEAAQLSRMEDAALLSDGRLLLLLTTTTPGTGTPSIFEGHTDIALVRLLENGEFDTEFAAAAPIPDTVPDGFPFSPLTVPHGTAYVTSGPALIVGINQATRVEVVGGSGSFAIGCTGAYQATPAQISRGQTLCARGSASPVAGGIASVTLSVGGRESTFTINSSATAVDVTPDAFVFTAQSAVGVSTNVVSNPVTIAGINGPAVLTVEGGEYSIGCAPGSFVSSSGYIENGQSVCVRHTTSSSASTPTITRLHVGTALGEFTSTTEVKKKKSGGGRSSIFELIAMLGLVLVRFGRGSQRSLNPFATM